MNYNDEILENKPFNFFKQLTYNIALAICIMLVGVLILVHGFKFGLYEVLTGSEEPYLPTGCMVVVKAQDEYKVGDLIKFDTSGKGSLPTVHRLVAIIDGHYICHGDNTQNVDGSYPESIEDSGWEDDAAFIQDLLENGATYETMISNELIKNVQTVDLNEIEGKVVAHIDNYGTYFKFIQDHSMLIIALVAGIWCFSNVIQNEIDMKKCRRLA